MQKKAQALFGSPDAADPAPTQTAEAKELSLVGKMELRIALADSDAKLESLLHTYLAPLLLKLASDHSTVRNKVSLENRNGASMKGPDAHWLLASHHRGCTSIFLAADN